MKNVILFLICLFILSNPLVVQAGGSPDKLSKECQINAKELYQYMISNGYTKEAACGLLGNADQESSISSGWGGNGHYGAFQCSSGTMNNCKEWCKDNNLDDTKPVNQFRFLEATILENDFKTYVVDYPFSKFKKTTDITEAVEAFMVAYERCVGGSYALTKVKNKVGGTQKYQEGDIRITYAKEFYKFMEGVEPVSGTSSGADSNKDGMDDGSGQVMNDSGLRVINGQYFCENKISSWVKLSEPNIYAEYLVDATRNDLISSELDTLHNWEQNIEKGEESNLLISLSRKLVVGAGILLVVWSVLLYLCYWFDRINTFLDIDLLKVISGGKLVKSPEECECTFGAQNIDKAKDGQVITVNHRTIIKICMIGVSVGVCIISGLLFSALRVLIYFIKDILS